MNQSEELLDVVDQQDQVVAVRRRGDIHALGLMHRAIHILLFNHSGEVFLQKRSMSKDENPGLWDSSAAGHVDSGESYEECAERELFEELGIKATQALEFLFKLSPSKATGNEHSVIYRYRFDGALNLQAEEIDDGIWIDAQQLDERVSRGDPALTVNLILIWNRYRSASD